MLLRRAQTGELNAIDQAHHAHLSGILAGAWRRRLPPRLVAAITLHDDPWREADRAPLFDEDTGLPYDFISTPLEHRLELYTDGIDALEEVDSYVALMVSMHYTTFSGTRDVDALQTRERKRRERLRPLLDDERVQRADDDLRWMKYFDIFSLHICLTGPDVDEDDVPRWLHDTSSWSEAPDGTTVELSWRDRDTLVVQPWPFAGAQIRWELRYRPLDGPFDGAAAFAEGFEATELRHRLIRLVPADATPTD